MSLKLITFFLLNIGLQIQMLNSPVNRVFYGRHLEYFKVKNIFNIKQIESPCQNKAKYDLIFVEILQK